MNTGLPLSRYNPYPPDHPPAVTIIPSPPPSGTSTSAVIVNDLFRMLGALPSGMPGISPE